MRCSNKEVMNEFDESIAKLYNSYYSKYINKFIEIIESVKNIITISCCRNDGLITNNMIRNAYMDPECRDCKELAYSNLLEFQVSCMYKVVSYNASRSLMAYSIMNYTDKEIIKSLEANENNIMDAIFGIYNNYLMINEIMKRLDITIDYFDKNEPGVLIYNYLEDEIDRNNVVFDYLYNNDKIFKKMMKIKNLTPSYKFFINKTIFFTYLKCNINSFKYISYDSISRTVKRDLLEKIIKRNNNTIKNSISAFFNSKIEDIVLNFNIESDPNKLNEYIDNCQKFINSCMSFSSFLHFKTMFIKEYLKAYIL